MGLSHTSLVFEQAEILRRVSLDLPPLMKVCLKGTSLWVGVNGRRPTSAVGRIMLSIILHTLGEIVCFKVKLILRIVMNFLSWDNSRFRKRKFTKERYLNYHSPLVPRCISHMNLFFFYFVMISLRKYKLIIQFKVDSRLSLLNLNIIEKDEQNSLVIQ